MSTSNEPHNTEFPEKYPEGEQGDFYSIHGACITCGAPEFEAPDLIAHSEKEYGHCYFKKQPKTPEELDRAINALAVSCIAGIRYGGKNEEILKRFYEMGLEKECDYKPVGNYIMIVRNKVIFRYEGTIKQLYENFSAKLLAQSYDDNEILKYKTNDTDYFEFLYRDTIFKCRLTAIGQYTIKIFIKTKEHYLINMKNLSTDIHSIMLKDDTISEIVWFDIDGNSYHPHEILY